MAPRVTVIIDYKRSDDDAADGYHRAEELLKQDYENSPTSLKPIPETNEETFYQHQGEGIVNNLHPKR